MVSPNTAAKLAAKIAVRAGTLVAAAALAAMPLAALSMRECGLAYKDAQRSGALGGLSWQEFRKARCGAGTATAPTGPDAGAKTGGPQTGPKTGPKTGPRTGAAAGAPPTAGPAAGLAPGGRAYLPAGRAVFPTAIAPKYGDETPGKGRRQTCLDQYRLNKASDANGGLQWVQKGGGYYSECNKRLKGGWKP
jgi:hypothetical protein